jgi:hypothetical protein
MDNTVFVSDTVKNVLAGFGSIGSIAVAAQENSGISKFGAPSEPGTPEVLPKIEVEAKPAKGFSHMIGNIITLIALYFAFKCKTPSGGIDFVQIIIACCCAPCYVVYRLANPCK